MIGMDVKCEIASAIVERQWNKTHWESEPHSIESENGDIRYIEEVQDEFNNILDIIDEILGDE